jgi:hypothetical protein
MEKCPKKGILLQKLESKMTRKRKMMNNWNGFLVFFCIKSSPPLSRGQEFFYKKIKRNLRLCGLHRFFMTEIQDIKQNVPDIWYLYFGFVSCFVFQMVGSLSPD